MMFVAGLALGDNSQVMDGAEEWSVVLIVCSIIWFIFWCLAVLKAMADA